MNLQKINEFLTKGMIGVFVSIFPFVALTLQFPIFSNIIAFQLILLMVITAVNFVLTTYLLIIQINSIIDSLFKQYEQGKSGNTL